MLTQNQMATYESLGYLRIAQAFDPASAESMTDFVWERLSELHGVRRNDRRTWRSEAPWAGLNRFKHEPIFQAVGSPVVRAAIDDLLGAGCWKQPATWGGFLIKFPDQTRETWDLPVDTYWHVDFHFTYEPRTPFGLRVFSFLSAVTPHAGGTVVVSGSHRLVEQFVSSLTSQERRARFAVLRDRFNASNSWFARLTNAGAGQPGRVEFFMNETGVVDGVPVRVEELCADPGDVVITHPWLVHAPSPNASDHPRFMLAKDIFSKLSKQPAPKVGNAAHAT